MWPLYVIQLLNQYFLQISKIKKSEKEKEMGKLVTCIAIAIEINRELQRGSDLIISFRKKMSFQESKRSWGV